MTIERDPTSALLFVLTQPVRRRILRIMTDSEPIPISPTEIADRLEEPLSNIGHHVRVCADHGVSEMVNEKTVRGASQHFYVSRVKAPWALEVLRLTQIPPLAIRKAEETGG